MTKTRIGIGAVVLVALALSGVWGLAGDQDDAARQDDHVAARAVNDDDHPEDLDRDPRTGAAVQHLGRTVKLELTLIGEEEPSFIVLCAANDFVINHDVSGPDHEHAVEITGQVHPTDDPNRIFLTFKAMTHHADHNEAFDATFQAEGSASVKMAEKTTLATLGDEPLTLTATEQQ